MGGCFAQSVKMQSESNGGVTKRDSIAYCDTVDCAAGFNNSKPLSLTFALKRVYLAGFGAQERF